MPEMTHVWRGRNFLPERHGQWLHILVSRYGKHLVEFEDGHRTVTVRGTFRKIKETDDDHVPSEPHRCQARGAAARPPPAL